MHRNSISWICRLKFRMENFFIHLLTYRPSDRNHRMHRNRPGRRFDFCQRADSCIFHNCSWLLWLGLINVQKSRTLEISICTNTFNNQCCRSGGSLGGGAPFFKLGGGGLSPPSTLENREFIMSQRRFSDLAILNTECTHVQERQERT